MTTNIVLGAARNTAFNDRLDNLYILDLFASHALQQGHGVGVDGNLVNVQGAAVGNIVVATFALLLLQTEGDATDGSLLDAAHQAGRVAGNLVAQTLGGHLGKVIQDTLVGLEVQGELRVMLFDEDARSTLDSLGTNAALLERVSNRCFKKRIWHGINGIWMDG